jgi:hypothetical protein
VQKENRFPNIDAAVLVDMHPIYIQNLIEQSSLQLNISQEQAEKHTIDLVVNQTKALMELNEKNIPVYSIQMKGAGMLESTLQENVFFDKTYFKRPVHGDLSWKFQFSLDMLEKKHKNIMTAGLYLGDCINDVNSLLNGNNIDVFTPADLVDDPEIFQYSSFDTVNRATFNYVHSYKELLK